MFPPIADASRGKDASQGMVSITKDISQKLRTLSSLSSVHNSILSHQLHPLWTKGHTDKWKAQANAQ